MGNTKSNNKIPAILCEPTYHIYSDTGAWDVATLKKLVIDGRLAPFYPPVSEVPPIPTTNTNNNTIITTTANHSHHHTNNNSTTTTTSQEQNRGRKRSTNSSTPDRKSSILSRFHTILHVNNNNNENNNHSTAVEQTSSSDPQAPRPLDEFYDECPICMMYYQGGMNVAKCCSQRICSECVIQICKQGPKHAETSSVCPFCKSCPFKIDYKGPKPWSQRCRELEEEQAVIQLKIKHQQEEDKQQEEERKKRLESSNSLNNSQQDASILSNLTRNNNTNTSFTSTTTTTTTNTLSNNNSFSSPTISTPSTNLVNPASGISFLETYFANRRMNEHQHQQQQQTEESLTTTTNNSTTPTSSTYSTQNQDNDDSYFRYIFGTDRAPSSPTRTLQHALISRLQNRFFIEDDTADEDEEEDEHDYLGYYLAGNRSPIRRPAGPIYNNTNNNTRVGTPNRATNNNAAMSSSTVTPTTNNNSSTPTNDHIEGLPTFSDFIPNSIDVTNVSADDEMLNEAIRLSLLEQGTTHHESVILDFNIPINHTNTSNNISNNISVGINTTTTQQSISISPIISSPLSNLPNHSANTNQTISNSSVTFEENDEELQMVLRLSLLDK